MPLKYWKHCAMALLVLVGSLAQAQNILILTTGAKNTPNSSNDLENNYMPYVVDEYAKPSAWSDFANGAAQCDNVTRTGIDPVTQKTKSVTCNQTLLVDGQALPANFFDAGYDLLVLASAYTTIDSGDWNTIQAAVASRKVRGVVLYIDSVNTNNRVLIPQLLNASMGSSVGVGAAFGAGNAYFPRNDTATVASYFSGLNTLELNSGFQAYSNVPAKLALYTGTRVQATDPAVTVSPGTTTQAAAVFIPHDDSYSGNGACVFGIPDIGWGRHGTGHNIGKLGAAFLAVFNDANGPCAQPLASPPVLKITKTTLTSTTAAPANGATVPYTVEVSNTSPTALALNVDVTDNAPTGMSLGQWTCTQVLPATPTGLCPTALPAGNLSTRIPSLPAGALLRFTVDATVVNNQQDLTNTATLTLPAGATCDGGASPCAASVTFPAPPAAVLRITKTTSANTGTAPAQGATVPYQVEVRNLSAITDVANVLVEDAQPTGMTFGAWSCSVLVPGTPAATCPAALPTGSLSTTIAALPAGAALQFSVTGTVTNAQSSLTNTATLTVPANAQCENNATPCAAQVTLPAQPPVTSPTPAPVPTLSQWAGIVLTLVMGCFGLFALRRREVFVR